MSLASKVRNSKIPNNPIDYDMKALVDAYVDLYGWDEIGMTDEDILEEILADAYGGIDIFAGHTYEGATRFTEAVKGAVEIEEHSGKKNTAVENDSGGKFSRMPGEKYALKSDSNIEAENIKSGKDAVNKMIEEAKTSEDPSTIVVKNAMYRSDIGYIDFKWGTPGHGEKFKGGYGLSHIIAKRNAENGNGEEAAYKLVEVIAKAREYDLQNNGQVGAGFERMRLYYDEYTAVLVKEKTGNRWLLTGWENEKEADAYAAGEVHDSSGATAANPTLTRIDGVNAFASKRSVTQEKEKSNGKFSREVSTEDLEKMQEKLTRVRQQLYAKRKQAAYWKAEATERHEGRARPGDVGAAANDVVTEFNSTLEAVDISDRMQKLADGIVSGKMNPNRAVDLAMDIAGDIVWHKKAIKGSHIGKMQICHIGEIQIFLFCRENV